MRVLVLLVAAGLATAAFAAATTAPTVMVTTNELIQAVGTKTFCNVGISKTLMPGKLAILCFKGTTKGGIYYPTYMVGLADDPTLGRRAAVYAYNGKGSPAQVYRTPAAATATVPLLRLATGEVALLPGHRIACNVGKGKDGIVIICLSVSPGTLVPAPNGLTILAGDAGVAVARLSTDGKSEQKLVVKTNP
ncbi:MAG: hypothetical protein WCH31_01520 [Actinomycetes bacterium]